MAIARLHMKVGKTRNASSHASYIAREGKYRSRLEQGEKLEHTEYGNMPSWAKDDPNLFWQSSDYYERKNGTNYREMEIALPRELTADQRKALVNEFVHQEIGKKHAYQYAIHNPKSLDGGEQPHVHLMFSERLNDGIDRDPEQYFKRYNAKNPEKGGARKQYGEVDPNLKLGKERTEARTNELKQLRDRWEQSCNKHLIKHGYKDNVISMKSYKEQGINLLPEKKQLPSQWRDKAIKADIINFRDAKAEYKQADKELKQEVPSIKAEIISLEKYKQNQEEKNSTQSTVKSQKEENRFNIDSGKSSISDDNKPLDKLEQRLQTLNAKQSKLDEVIGGKESKQERYYELAEKNQKNGERARLASSYEVNKTLLSKTDNEIKTIDERVKQQRDKLEKEEKAYNESKKGLFGFMKKDEKKEQSFKDQREKIAEAEKAKIPLLKSKQELEERVRKQEYVLNKTPKMSEQEKQEYSQLKEQRETQKEQYEKIQQEKQEIERDKQRIEREKEPEQKQKDKDIDHEM